MHSVTFFSNVGVKKQTKKLKSSGCAVDVQCFPGMIWLGPYLIMIWYDMIWYDMIWYDMIWYDMIWYDMIWYDMADILWCERSIVYCLLR